MGSVELCRRCRKRVALVPAGLEVNVCTICDPGSYDWIDGRPQWKR